MQAPKLLIRKAMVNVQGRIRPCVQIIAEIDPKMKDMLNQQFSTEALFKRVMYQSGLPQGAPPPGPSLAPHLSSFLKNDACPEITVKTILAGQLYQAASLWEVMAFEYIAKRSFDSLTELLLSATELGSETVYYSDTSNIALFAADTAAEMGVTPESVPPGAEAMANAA